ncbi:alpha-2-macroglobulin-like [Anabas testudineus]|uniref:alpha-2-macroglobulin-like n=1 Tax=Anabas testudineus TaxID=64144 RepID=UPI000E45FA2D|nr:alpha-2-macroglobulin-like [Anabas testudineus]
MGRPGIQMWTWTLCVFLKWLSVDQVLGEPQYMVAIPAVLEAGSETKFCASLLQPSRSVVMTVTLVSEEKSTTLLKHTSSEEFHMCTQFKVPLVQNNEVQTFQVEVRSSIFYSKQVRKVMIKVYQPLTFVQTDKPLYLPGQTVHFRVITLDTKFRLVNQMYNVIEIKDAKNNRVGQWLNETSNGKILQLSYSLNSEAHEGNYKITVSPGENEVGHDFKVEKYVLPKFDVKINSPDEVIIKQEEIEVEVCAKYTYGQSVPGSVNVVVCRPPYYPIFYWKHNWAVPCYNETKETDKKGCTTFTIKMSTFKNPHHIMLGDILTLDANMKEQGTGVSHLQQKMIRISYVVGKLSFNDTPKIYRPGSIVEGKVQALYYNNTPISNMPLYLFERKRIGDTQSSRLLQNLETDSDGVAAFSFSTVNYSWDINLHVQSDKKFTDSYLRTQGESFPRKTHYEDGAHTIQQFSSGTSLRVKKKDKPLSCDTEEDIFIQYTVVGEAQGKVDVMYLVLSRGAIVMQGYKEIKVKDISVNEGEVSFKLKVSPEMAPEVQIVAYAVLPNETVIANSADFSTEKCFSHKVSLEFSPSPAVPGEEVIMQVSADPDSLCGVSAVDQSVLIKEPGKSLNADQIFKLLPVTKISRIPNEVKEPKCLTVRAKRNIFGYSGRDEKNDAYAVFENIGLKMATNLLLRIPSCVELKGIVYNHGEIFFHLMLNIHSHHTCITGERGSVGIPMRMANSLSAYIPPIITVHTFFPETWIWDLVEVGESGTKDVSLTVPDTITTWETEAFCLSSQGFGLAPRKEIKVFQHFFLELTLPYSIIRGEHFELKATIFNYLTSCISVTVTPAPSLHYTLTPLSGDQYTSCLCENERKTFRWTMVPSALGTVNVTAEAVASHLSCDNEIVRVLDRGRNHKVTKSLIVKAEGTEITKAYNWLLCPKGEALTEEINIQLPENVIDGSARASVSVLGDILGRALQDLDGLLHIPYGSGEQNMALLAPSIYILQYLKNTQQLTPIISEKAANFLTSGYHRQLNYKHNDGAYSTFESGPGNTWLTAFVLRSFTKAQTFIYIDPTKIEESKAWLKNKQRENGCFEQSGKLFNNRMKGGVSDEVTLTAYITAAFLEMNMSAESPVMTKSLLCIKESISDLSNTYTTALLAYVFTLAGDMETRAHLLQHLDTVASKQGGSLHWSQTARQTLAPLSVEISSYVLLAKLSTSPTNEDLIYSSRIVRWLTGQQNYYGGFSSTQDTVVALQALALYSTLMFSPEGSSMVTVQSPSGQLTFDVNQENKLLYQEKTLQDTTGKYSLEVKGTACASVQISLHYNIPTLPDVNTLSVEVKPEANCSESLKPSLTLKLNLLFSGTENSTNMVILDIKLLSGFVPVSKSLKRVS